MKQASDWPRCDRAGSALTTGRPDGRQEFSVGAKSASASSEFIAGPHNRRWSASGSAQNAPKAVVFCEVRPKIAVAHDPGEGCSFDMFGNGLLPKRKSKARVAIEAFRSQNRFLVEVFDSASNVVNLARYVMVMGTNEQFGSALELLLGFSRDRQDHSIDAPAVLVKPFENVSIRTRLGINVQGPKQPPRAAWNYGDTTVFTLYAGDRVIGNRQPLAQ